MMNNSLSEISNEELLAMCKAKETEAKRLHAEVYILLLKAEKECKEGLFMQRELESRGVKIDEK